MDQRNRSVQAGLVVFEYVDLFEIDGVTRRTGVLPAAIDATLYVGPTDSAWPVVAGAGVQDVAVAAGNIYWQEFETGFYCVRFFPNQVGAWRLLLTWPVVSQTLSVIYDVTPRVNAASDALGIRAAFVR